MCTLKEKKQKKILRHIYKLYAAGFIWHHLITNWCFVNVHSDELSAFIESKGAPAPGILTLTTSLSNVGSIYCL